MNEEEGVEQKHGVSLEGLEHDQNQPMDDFDYVEPNNQANYHDGDYAEQQDPYNNALGLGSGDAMGIDDDNDMEDEIDEVGGDGVE